MDDRRLRHATAMPCCFLHGGVGGDFCLAFARSNWIPEASKALRSIIERKIN